MWTEQRSRDGIVDYLLSGELRQKQQARLRTRLVKRRECQGLVILEPREEAPAELELFSQEHFLPGVSQEKGNSERLGKMSNIIIYLFLCTL